MGKMAKVDFAKLLGFDSVHCELPKGVDFRGEAVSAKLGAKVGTEICLALDLQPAPADSGTKLGELANKDD